MVLNLFKVGYALHLSDLTRHCVTPSPPERAFVAFSLEKEAVQSEDEGSKKTAHDLMI